MNQETILTRWEKLIDCVDQVNFDSLKEDGFKEHGKLYD